MRVSIINLNMGTHDATGRCMLNQLQFFQARGDNAKIYIQSEPVGVPDALRQHIVNTTLHDLVSRLNSHFHASELYIFHYAGYYHLLESMKGIDEGVVMLSYHNVTPTALWGTDTLIDHLQESNDKVDTLIPFADLVVVDSPYTKTDLLEQERCEEHRIAVLPLAADLADFSPQKKPGALTTRYNLHDKSIILFVGRMAGNKRVDLLVEALPLVREKVPNATLLLVGDDKSNPAFDDIVSPIKERAKALGLAEAVIFTGRVDDLPPYYHLADVYASASLHEGFGVPIVEAMASGIPVVASRATAHPWVMGEAGLLVEPENAPDLAEKISQVLSDSSLAEDLKQRGLARAQQFSLEAYQQGFSEVVDKALTLLPQQTYFRANSLLNRRIQTAELDREALRPTLREVLLVGKLGPLKLLADIVDRQYQIASSIPVLGKVVVAARHNLTSHLWQPYLTPALERQVTVNTLFIDLFQQLTQYLFGYAAQWDARAQDQQNQQDALAQRMGRLEQWLGLVDDQMAVWDTDSLSSEKVKQIADLRSQVTSIRQALDKGE
ncbi:MAG: glycosyltransferase family 1 protein [Chloroflexota bacterium]